jgi:hypothetical protein
MVIDSLTKGLITTQKLHRYLISVILLECKNYDLHSRNENNYLKEGTSRASRENESRSTNKDGLRSVSQSLSTMLTAAFNIIKRLILLDILDGSSDHCIYWISAFD